MGDNLAALVAWKGAERIKQFVMQTIRLCTPHNATPHCPFLLVSFAITLPYPHQCRQLGRLSTTHVARHNCPTTLAVHPDEPHACCTMTTHPLPPKRTLTCLSRPQDAFDASMRVL